MRVHAKCDSQQAGPTFLSSACFLALAFLESPSLGLAAAALAASAFACALALAAALAFALAS